MDNIDLRKELQFARDVVKKIKLQGAESEIDAYMDLVCGDVLVAEENLQNHLLGWENASLAREFLRYARPLEGYDHTLNQLYDAVTRMIDTIYEHPRLKSELLKFKLQIVQRIECMNDMELDESEDLKIEIEEIDKNIALADKGFLDKIVVRHSHLKSDPVEWTARWEEVIDEVDKKVDEILSDHPRGMGFCFAFWSTRMEVLKSDFDIDWASPSLMNPRVCFD